MDTAMVKRLWTRPRASIKTAEAVRRFLNMAGDIRLSRNMLPVIKRIVNTRADVMRMRCENGCGG